MKHLFLMIIRMLIIGLLVLLFARPSFVENVSMIPKSGANGDADSTSFSSAPTATVFLFDTSVRMEYVSENQSSLARAQVAAGRILRNLSSRSVASVVTTHLAPLAFSADFGEIQRQILEIETSTVARTIPEAFQDALALVKTSNLAQKEIYIFTDMTAKSWEMDGARKRQEIEKQLKSIPNVRITIIDTGVEKPENVQLDVWDENAFQAVTGGACEIRTKLLTQGMHPHRVGIFLVDEYGKPQLKGEVSTESVNAENENTEEQVVLPLTFQLGGLKNGLNQGFVALLDGDPLVADNVRAFTIQKEPPMPILFVACEPAERNAFFACQTLMPTQFALENRAKYDVTVLSFPQFSQWVSGYGASRSGTLNRYQAIFFLNPPEFSVPEWNLLAQYVHAGGGVAFFLGDALENPETFQIAEARGVLPAIPGFQARFPSGTYLTPLWQTAHPILRAFQTLDTPIPWDESPVFRAWTLTDLAEGAQELFTWADGTPALVVRQNGTGQVLLAGTPIHPTMNRSQTIWNLIPRGDSWVFLVLMNTVAAYLTSEERVSENVVVQEPVSIPLRNMQESRFQLEFLPCVMQREKEEKNESDRPKNTEAEVILVPDTERGMLDIPALERVGNYRVRGSDTDYLRGFSVNLPLATTDMTRTEPEKIRQIFKPLEITFLTDVDSLVRNLAGVRSSGELFHLIGFLLLVLLGAECVGEYLISVPFRKV